MRALILSLSFFHAIRMLSFEQLYMFPQGAVALAPTPSNGFFQEQRTCHQRIRHNFISHICFIILSIILSAVSFTVLCPFLSAALSAILSPVFSIVLSTILSRGFIALSIIILSLKIITACAECEMTAAHDVGGNN